MSKMNTNYHTNIMILMDVNSVYSRCLTKHNSLASLKQEVFQRKLGNF
jgi:hypothetical protein